jgi:hypothetical protein
VVCRKPGGGHLVEKRKKGLEIMAINQGYFCDAIESSGSG